MKCEICKIHSATRSIQRQIDGVKRELFVCDACARMAPNGAGVPTSLTDVLFSLDLPMGGGTAIEDLVCPVCGLSRNELRDKRRMGCSHCFQTFESDIRSFVVPQQSVDSGGGPVPYFPFDMGETDVGVLKKALALAIEEERYEDAGQLVKQLRAVTGAQGATEAHEGDDSHG